MLKPEYTARFKKDLKTVEKRRLNIELLKQINSIKNGMIVFERTGTHSDLF